MKIAIASGKGGTGKTLVSTNLFWVAQKAGSFVSLIDCDAEEPNVTEFITGDVISVERVFQNIPVIDTEQCVYCGRCYEYCNYNAIVFLPDRKFIKVVDDLCHDCGACSVVCKYGAITEKDKLLGTVKSISFATHAEIVEARADVGVYSPVPVIKKAIEKAGDKSLTIFDSPPGISCPFIATVDRADFVVLVTEPTPFGLNDLKLSVETLREINKPYGVIVNRSDLGNSEVYDWLNENNIPLLMKIPFDREIARIYSIGHLLVQENEIYKKQFEELLMTIKNRME